MPAWSQLSVQSIPKPGPRTLQTIRRAGQISTIVRSYLFLKILLTAYRHLYAYGIVGTSTQIYNALKHFIVGLMLKLPSNRAKLNSEIGATRKELVSKLAPTTYPEGIHITNVRSMPEHGRDLDWLRSEWVNLRKLAKNDVDEGRVSGAVYHGGEDLNQVISEACAQFVVSNPLHVDVFPGVRKMEAEIVSIVLKLFNGEKGAGTTTSGGTESILMSVKTHRDWARATKGIKEPEMVIPSSAHAAFWKAAQYFCIKLHVVPVDPVTRQVCPKRMARFINPNTIMIVGSAPNFPDGIVDRIPELGALAKRKNIGLHVDCCLGSFIIAYAAKAGYGEGLPKFDFSVPGVTAISCDIHKYGFCPKGTSVIMYRSQALRRYQFFSLPEWAGGIYASPSMAGSRPGAVIAGAWAVINYIGADGYTDSAKTIITAARHFATEIVKRFPDDIYILGDPKLSVVAFGSKTLNIYGVGDAMSAKGWHLNALANPPALHMAFTRLTAASVDKLLDDLTEVVHAEMKAPTAGGNTVAVYGIGQTAAGPYVVDEIAKMFVDILYE